MRKSSARLTLVLTCCIVLGIAAVSAPVSAQSDFIRGDTNFDGSVNGLIDGLFLLNYQFTVGAPIPPCLDAADVNDDGTVSGLLDGLYLLNFQFVFGSPQPPAPFPAPGVDPTPDTLDDGACAPVVVVTPGIVDTLARGCNSGLAEGEYLVETDVNWDALWTMHTSTLANPPARPNVDFSTDVVVILVRDFFNGTHEVEIDDLEDISSDILITSRLINHNQLPCAALFIPTQPFHMVRWENAAAAGVPTTTVNDETVLDTCILPTLCFQKRQRTSGVPLWSELWKSPRIL